MVPSSEKLTVNIPPGVDNDMQLRLAGKGEPGRAGGPPGNLYVTLRVEPHAEFQRQGDDVFSTFFVSYPQACLGGHVRVATVDGDAELEVPAGTPSGRVFLLQGKGAPRLRGHGRGDHHVQIVVAVPKALSAEEEDLVRRLAALQDASIKEKGFWRDLVSRLKA
jgi:molecular chaperone DnaJ